MFQFISDFVNSNSISTLITIVSFLFGVFGFAGFLIQLRDRRRTVLCVASSKKCIIDANEVSGTGMSITYRQYQIPDGFNVNVAKVHIYNKGEHIVKDSDIDKNDPIKITFDEGESVLDAKITKVSSNLCDFSVQPDTHSVIVTFSKMESHDFVNLKIPFISKESIYLKKDKPESYSPLSCLGTILDEGKVKTVRIDDDKYDSNRTNITRSKILNFILRDVFTSAIMALYLFGFLYLFTTVFPIKSAIIFFVLWIGGDMGFVALYLLIIEKVGALINRRKGYS